MALFLRELFTCVSAAVTDQAINAPLPAAQKVSLKLRAGVMICGVRNKETLMPQIVKDPIVIKADMETHRLTAEISGTGTRQTIMTTIAETAIK